MADIQLLIYRLHLTYQTLVLYQKISWLKLFYRNMYYRNSGYDNTNVQL